METVSKDPGLEGATITDNVEPHNAGFDYAPLFEAEAVTDEQLKGEQDTAAKPADAEPKVEPPEKTASDASKEPAQNQPPENEPEKKPEADQEKKAENEPEKPPPGYVPQVALHQERQANKGLKAEIARLSAEVEKLSTKPVQEDTAFKDFKILDDDEFEKLLLDDPDEATRYQYKFTRYQDHQRKVQERQLAEKRSTEATHAIVGEAMRAIDEILPGIYSKSGNEMAGKLVDFASKSGVHPDVLQVMTDPQTKLTTPDGKSYLLGYGAAQIIGLIKSNYEIASNTPDANQLRNQIESELRPKIEAEVQETLMKKLQSDPNGFRSVDQIAGSGKKDSRPRMGVMTEAEFAKLPAQEQNALLGA